GVQTCALPIWSDCSSETIATSTMTVDRFIQDRVHGIFTPGTEGTWYYRVDAWSDPIATWRDADEKKMAAGQDAAELANDLAHGSNLYARAGLALNGDQKRV